MEGSETLLCSVFLCSETSISHPNGLVWLDFLAMPLRSILTSREHVSGLSSLEGPFLSFVAQGMVILLAGIPHSRAASLPPLPGLWP